MYMYVYNTLFVLCCADYIIIFLLSISIPCRNDIVVVMLRYLNELSICYLGCGTQENAQVTHSLSEHW